jgi:hypothetical protein
MKTLFKTKQSEARSTAHWESVTRSDCKQEFLIWRNPSNAVQKCSPYAFPKGDFRNQFIDELTMQRIDQYRWAFPGPFVMGHGFEVISRGACASSPALSSCDASCSANGVGDFEAAGHLLE